MSTEIICASSTPSAVSSSIIDAENSLKDSVSTTTPSTAAVTNTSTVSSIAAATIKSSEESLKHLRNSLFLDFSSTKRQRNVLDDELLNIIKSSPNLEKILTQAASSTPTPTKLLYPTEVSLAQRQYAQGFIDALAQVQQLNGFVPTPTLLNSPSFLAPLLQSTTPTTEAIVSDASVSSSAMASPANESLSVFMQAAMNGMGTLNSYSFSQMPEQNTYTSSSQSALSANAATFASTSSCANHEFRTASIFSNSINNMMDDSVNGIELDLYGVNDSMSDGTVNVSDVVGSSSSPLLSSSSIKNHENINNNTFNSDSYDAIDQERKKLERKRARNRMAATKCRQRKLQRISELEKQVCEEQAAGHKLSQNLSLLEAAVVQLRQAFHEHNSRGCVFRTD